MKLRIIQSYARVIPFQSVILFRRIISVSSFSNKDNIIKTYKFNQLPNKIGWYLRCGHINQLKQRIEREEKELQLDDSFSSHHLKWNYKTTKDICSFNGQDEQNLEIFRYLFEKIPEWFNHPDCFKMAASKGNIEIFKILADNTVPIKPSFDMNECIQVAIQGMHLDMATYLLEMNDYKFKVTSIFSIKGALFKYSQSDLIKLARIFIDIVKNNERVTMEKLCRQYFYKLLLATRDIETVKYAHANYYVDTEFYLPHSYVYYLRKGAPKDMDLDQHLDFIKQVLQLFDTDFETDLQNMVTDEEMDSIEKNLEKDQENYHNNGNYCYFDSLSQLSTKQSRWYMFMFGMYFNQELNAHQNIESYWRDLPHIFKVRVKDEEKDDDEEEDKEEWPSQEKEEFIMKICEKFGKEFIINHGTLEHVKWVHKILGFRCANDILFYPKHQDSNQTLAIAQYLHDNGVDPFSKSPYLVDHLRKGDDKVILFIHQHYPHLVKRDDILNYIKRHGCHYYLSNLDLVEQG
ncbi:hypothetical protein DFA_02296 [Cavenderia fasciculata]|uniref:Ankyrin repeat protein n=1 Tax=Cavenderia fasciculata TaxID=261658 RepID=F4PZ23_CACFS|nr:uncharacterized protein DFA_02296 [Cavenderia fasciculata]EGG19052.1 hypothetical protein DFA_02296 [Cavenderia fasciculata]|eukprot:XP_004366685.1 hypothetical protein DFA_02296 [Cavenderia fasciculata]